MEEALQLAQGAGFQQAVARGHYLAGNFLQALHCAIHATSTPGAPHCYYPTQLLQLMSSACLLCVVQCCASVPLCFAHDTSSYI